MRAVVVATLVLVLGAAGCGGGDGDEGADTPGTAAMQVDADIKDFEYVPPKLTVSTGGRVSWTNEDSANHTVTFADKKLESIGNLRTNQKRLVTFATAGEYAYVCAYHPSMRGTVVVRG